jgi:hypothetical protein
MSAKTPALRHIAGGRFFQECNTDAPAHIRSRAHTPKRPHRENSRAGVLGTKRVKNRHNQPKNLTFRPISKS